MSAAVGPRFQGRRFRGRGAPPQRTDALAPPRLPQIRAAGRHVTDHHHHTQQEGTTHMLDRSQIDATVFRVAVAAFTYYPDKPTRESGYTLDEDLDWCIRPLRQLPEADRRELREQIASLVTDPCADRQAFIRRLQRYVENTEQ
jgi:hypothetical protein